MTSKPELLITINVPSPESLVSANINGLALGCRQTYGITKDLRQMVDIRDFQES